MASSLFMQFLDATILTTALPYIGKSLDVPTNSLSLTVSIYFITMAIFIPLSGWIAKRIGKKNAWMLATSLFVLSSLGDAVAPTFSFLLISRFVQGFAGSLMTPTARLIMLEKTPSNQLLKMANYLVWPALIAPAIAPMLGGFIVKYLSWQWIFLLNIPIGLIAVIIGNKLIEKDDNKIRSKFDLLGFIEIAMSSGLILIGAEIATYGKYLWTLSSILVIIGLLMILLVGYHLSKTKEPLFEIKALKVSSFRIYQTGGTFLWLSVGALPYLLTIYLQTVFHWSALTAGYYVIFVFIGNIGIKPFTNMIIKAIKYKWSLILALITVAVSTALIALVRPNTSGIIIALLALLSGCGRSLALTCYNAVTFSEIPMNERNSANTLSSVLQTMAQGLGVSLISVIVSALSTFVSVNIAYEYGFIFLGILMIYPIIEVLIQPKDFGFKAL
ncbi:MFS transporter [Apilactobacillus timberlakei]|uniref:MFS transporter n=1 Tax=Apilactobacillus timberlakei TaxID=2008380 RepID=A0ABY2YX27_9LACO|nr:MFS transporter [Apilactobacillus timberlakei]TPR12600.1 MFS transporter [Apilactobacillus timberlakei]TPR13431.1 MFS transporter [Apilactobacillus timberlakei]TPR15504.1 MFS transporter [Apilactobacillus timberlakei]TPR17763.1 MFS transporter [Apilactobacillus timberlakei]